MSKTVPPAHFSTFSITQGVPLCSCGTEHIPLLLKCEFPLAPTSPASTYPCGLGIDAHTARSIQESPPTRHLLGSCAYPRIIIVRPT